MRSLFTNKLLFVYFSFLPLIVLTEKPLFEGLENSRPNGLFYTYFTALYSGMLMEMEPIALLFVFEGGPITIYNRVMAYILPMCVPDIVIYIFPCNISS